MSDYAVVIGVQDYPHIGSLRGSCNDARLMYEWLVDPNGGGLDPKNVYTTLHAADGALVGGDGDAGDGNAQAGDPPSNTVGTVGRDDIVNVFRPLIEERVAKSVHEDGRLFIYASGHGVGNNSDSDDTALMASNTSSHLAMYVLLPAYADLFRRTWTFDEVILIMDCCRNPHPRIRIGRAEELMRVRAHEKANSVRFFEAYATGFPHVARERQFGNEYRGIFTTALLKALKAASPDDTGQVTGSIVKKYIHNIFGHVARGIDVESPKINVDDQDEVVFMHRQDAPEFDVIFEVDPVHAGSMIEILSGRRFEELGAIPVTGTMATTKLAPGFYLAQISGTSRRKSFEVVGYSDDDAVVTRVKFPTEPAQPIRPQR